MAPKKILLIDYEPRSIEKLRAPLEGAGYVVLVANDGVAGVRAFAAEKPQLVLVEAMLPKKHGFEVCQELKQSPQGKLTPVLVITSVYKGRKYRTQALHQYGANDYIEKPISDAALLEVIGRFLQPEPAHQGSPPPPAPPPQAAAPDVAAASEEVELEISQKLDALLPGATPTENVVSFDPGRARKRRGPVPTPAPAMAPVATRAGGVEPERVHAGPELAVSARVSPALDPQPDEEPASTPVVGPAVADAPSRTWLWVTLGLVALGGIAAAAALVLVG